MNEVDHLRGLAAWGNLGVKMGCFIDFLSSAKALKNVGFKVLQSNISTYMWRYGVGHKYIDTNNPFMINDR